MKKNTQLRDRRKEGGRNNEKGIGRMEGRKRSCRKAKDILTREINTQ